MSQMEPGPARNRLLVRLAAEDREHLMADVKPVRLEAKQVLLEQGEAVHHVYFPTGGLCSLVVVMRDGRTVAAATVGDEGVIGVSALLGAEHSPVEVVCHIPDGALRLPVETLRRHVDERPGIRGLLLRYAEVLLAQAQRNAACNRLHEVEPRLARWLLLAQDRVGVGELPLTQELLGMLLGVRRATVSLAAEALRTRGLIRYHRGHVTVVDRAGLQAAACEDYRAARDAERRLLAWTEGG